ncbi:hypothetical protein GCM10025863_19640 [Microbacterium suwonense]|uniref:Uncharacterized protein n=2 Tax=Microbacterium suwonense TaxID=683047 RepID=A0ABM8FV11_9MICO|nr:hypothetical protein GCM10025863_19640 [Microbacterium suwonense]
MPSASEATAIMCDTACDNWYGAMASSSVLQGLHSEPVTVLRLVLDDLVERLPGVNGRRKWMVGALIAVHHALLRAGEQVTPLRLDSLQPYITQSGDTTALHGWIETGPPASEVTEMLASARLSSVPDETWELYATRADISSRTTLWEAAVESIAPVTTLTAIASAGIADAALANAGQELIRATNTRARLRALDIFDTLPRNQKTAASLEPALEQWLSDARISEGRFVYELILRHHSALTRPAVTRMKRVIPTWFEKVRGNLPRPAEDQLRSLGYLRTPPKKRRKRRGRS